MKTVKKIATVASATIFCSLLIFQLAHAEVFEWVNERVTVHFTQDYKTTLKKYVQNLEREFWEKLTNQNFPLTLVEWQLTTIPEPRYKYVNKHIIGTVENKSEKEFSEVKIEFIVYDGEGDQIAIVFTHLYDFKPGGIWKFEILVTQDIEKAEFKGLYVPTKEIQKLEEERKTKGKEGFHSPFLCLSRRSLKKNLCVLSEAR